jgi:hypothetical protein
MSLIIRATQFGAFEQENKKKEHTHLSIQKDEERKISKEGYFISLNYPEKKD